MKPPKFHVGQAVVCLSASTALFYPDEKKPIPNKIYTVRTVNPGFIDPGWFLRFEEIINPPYYEGEECQFSEARFAPVELLPDEALAELLSETLEPVTA